MNVSPLGKRMVLYGFGIVLFSLFALRGGWQAFSFALRPSWVPLVGYFGSTLLLFLISSLRWGLITNTLMGRPVCSYFQFFFYFTLGRAAGQYVSQIGSDFVLKPLLMRTLKTVPIRKGITISLLEKGLDLLFALILSAPAGLWLTGQLPEGWFLTASALALVLPWSLVVLPDFTQGMLHLWFRAQRRQGSERLQPKRNGLWHLTDPELLGKLLTLTTLKYAALMIWTLLLVRTLDLSIPPLLIWAGIPIAQLSLVLAFTPGGIGVLEGGWYAVLALAGLPNETISAFLLGQRLYWTLFSALLLGIGWLLLRTRKQEKTKEVAPK